MLKNVTHSGGVEDVGEVLFTTPFGYMLPDAAASEECLLPVGERTLDALLNLGNAMGEASDPPAPDQDSEIPAVFTYLGQFIDHDVTARTDRENGFNRISQNDGQPRPMVPVPPNQVVAELRNGRRPQLDLDSLYGDGPLLLNTPLKVDTAGNPTLDDTEAMKLYEVVEQSGHWHPSGKLKLSDRGNGKVELPREGRTAVIGDGRNDENIAISQLHAAFAAFHNKVVDQLGSSGSGSSKYSKARQIVRWTYQYIVVHDYLMRVCDKDVVNDILRNGPYFFGPGTGGNELFMPLEFSVAGFRFGHSMIRPSYRIGASPATKTIAELLGVSTPKKPGEEAKDLLELHNGAWRLKAENLVHWSNFVDFGNTQTAQRARKIDPLISKGLFELPFEENAIAMAMIRHLAQRNLCRGYLLSIPSGQAFAAAMGVRPLRDGELYEPSADPDQPGPIQSALEHGRFLRRTPLWYYVLREAQVHKGGQSLGEVGSRIVAETIIGFVKHDPNSFWHNGYLSNPGYSLWSKLAWHGRVTPDGIKVPGRKKPIATLADMIDYVGLQK